MEKLTIDVFRHFRLFLKKNKIYDLFMLNFRTQPYGNIHCIDSLIPNYIETMMEYSTTTLGKEYVDGYGAMYLTFRSFCWAGDNRGIPKSWSKYWATVGLKWALYCIRHNIEICQDEILGRLVDYWDNNGWIDISKLSFEDKIIVKQLKYRKYHNGNIY